MTRGRGVQRVGNYTPGIPTRGAAEAAHRPRRHLIHPRLLRQPPRTDVVGWVVTSD
jgi:hypothetical protein